MHFNVIAAFIPSFSDISSIRARCKELHRKNEELTTLVKDYNTPVREADQYILGKDKILSTSGTTVAYLQEAQEKLKDENKSLIFASAKLIKNSKNVPISTSTSRHESISSSISTHLLGLSMKVEGKTPACTENKVRALQHFHIESTRIRTGFDRVWSRHIPWRSIGN